MKILHVITGLGSGGAERSLYNLLASSLSREFDNYVVSLSDDGVYGGLIRECKVPVIALNLQNFAQLPGFVWRLRKLARDIRPDIVQGWMYHGNLAATVVGGMAKQQPAIIWGVRQCLYNLKMEKPMTRNVVRLNKILSSKPNLIVYNSQLSREQHEAFGLTSRRAQVIPNGFDLNSWKQNLKQRQSLREKLGIPATARVVGHVARSHPMKNHPGFLRSAVRIAGMLPDTHFILSGRHVNLDNAVLANLVPIQFRQRFHFLGERKDIPDLMRAMDIFCLSSLWGEAFPNVLGEAMATGVPCVAADVGDSGIIVDDTGVIVPRLDENALFEGMLELLNKSPGERIDMGHAARKRIAEHYSLEAVVAQYTKLYEHLII